MSIERGVRLNDVQAHLVGGNVSDETISNQTARSCSNTMGETAALLARSMKSRQISKDSLETPPGEATGPAKVSLFAASSRAEPSRTEPKLWRQQQQQEPNFPRESTKYKHSKQVDSPFIQQAGERSHERATLANRMSRSSGSGVHRGEVEVSCSWKEPTRAPIRLPPLPSKPIVQKRAKPSLSRCRLLV